MSEMTMNGAVAIVPATRPAVDRMRGRASLRGWMLWLFVVLVSVVILQYSTYLVHSLVWDRVIKLQALFLLAVAFRYHAPPRRTWLTLVLYVMLLGSALGGTLLDGDPLGMIQLAKFAMQWVLLPLVVLRFRAGEPPPRRLIHFLIGWGVVFALQAATLWILIYFQVPVAMTQISMERYLGMTENSFGPLGILGYSNSLSDYDSSVSIRPQSWFIEPSTLASFLLYPMIMSFAMYRASRRKFWLVLTVVVIAGLLCTFSLAGFIASFAAVIVLLLIRPGQSRLKRIWSMVALISAPIILLLLSSFVLDQMHELWRKAERTGEWGSITRVLARDPEHEENRALVRSAFNVREIVETTVRNPLGVGMASTYGENTFNSPNAPLFWLGVSGFPGFALVLLLQAHLFFTYAMPLLRDRNPVLRGAAASYVAVTVHGLSYGTWVNPAYVIVVAIMILLANSNPRRTPVHAAPAVRHAPAI